jgi:hypothetical protein
MAVGTGYSSIVTNGLVFAYDTADSFNSYKGEPTTNYWNGNQYSIYNDGATNSRNSTDVAPPVPGYEVVKVTANNIGSYGQCILWNSTYPNNNVATITNSIYAYLTVGDYVQVGQHWYPWYYGTQKSIAKNQWVRISETYTINEGNSYGNAALTYSTNGIAYFAMPQYEYKSHVTPFIGANETRSNTQGLLDISGGNNTITLNNMTYDANALPAFDGSDDYIDTGKTAAQLGMYDSSYTAECVCYPTSFSNDRTMFGTDQTAFRQGLHLVFRSGQIYMGHYSSDYGAGSGTLNAWNHITYRFNASTGAASIFKNGVLQGTGTISSFIGTTNILLGRWAGSYYFSGNIAVQKIYNRPLSDGEILTNFNHYKTRFNLP